MIWGKYLKKEWVLLVLFVCTLWSPLVYSASNAKQADVADSKGDESSGSKNSKEADNDTEKRQSAPGSFEVDELAATRALERSLIRSDALLLSQGHMEFGFDYSFQFDEYLSPLLVEYETEESDVISTGLGQSRATITNHGMSWNFKIGLPRDAQIELSLPLKVERVEVSTMFDGTELESIYDQANGIGDLDVTVLKTLRREKGRLPDIIGRLSFNPDTGGSRKHGVIDIGSGANEFTFGIAATKRQDPLVFNYGVSHTISDSNNGVRAGAVTQLYSALYLAASPYTSISFAFNQTLVGDAKAKDGDIAGSDLMLGALSLGFSSTIGRDWFLSGGISTGLNESANDYSLSIGVSKRAALR